MRYINTRQARHSTRRKYRIKTIVRVLLIAICLAAQPSFKLYALDEAVIKPDTKNAAWYYSKAFKLLKYPDSKETGNKIQEIIRGGWQKEDKELEGILKGNEPSLKEFKKGLPLQKCDFDFGRKYQYIIQKETPTYSKIRSLYRLLLLKGRYYESKGEFTKAMDLYLSALTFARHVSQDNTMTLKMVALVIEKETYVPLQDCLNAGKLSKKDYMKIFNYLADYEKQHFSGEELIKLEKEAFLSTLYLLVDRYIEDSKVESSTQVKSDEKAKILALGDEIKKQGQELADKYFGNFIKAITTNKQEDWEFAANELNGLMKEAKPKIEDFPDFVKAFVADASKENAEALDKKLANKIVLAFLSVAMPNFKGVADGYYSALSQLDELKSFALIKATK